MNGWVIVVWTALMLTLGAIQIGITVTGWRPQGHYASTQNDPSPGPNALF